MRQLEDAGMAAVVMASLYEEQIRAEDTAYTRPTSSTSMLSSAPSMLRPSRSTCDDTRPLI